MILRALMLGDLLCAVPALRAFRLGFPQAEITLVGLAWARTFAERFNHLVDDFLELPGFPGLPEVEPRVRELPAFLAAAHDRRSDLAVQLHGSGRVTNTLAFLLGARHTAGFYPAGERCPDPVLFAEYPENGPEVHRLLRLPEHLGIPLDGDRLEFPLRRGDDEELAGLAPALGDAVVCIHPGARSARPWAPDAFAAVGDALAARGFTVVLTGSDAEREVTRRVSGLIEAPTVDLAGKTSLGALGALLARSRLLVSNDTGVSHLAAALRVPSVVVVTTSDPDRWAPLDRALHRVVARPESAEPVLAEADALLAATVAA